MARDLKRRLDKLEAKSTRGRPTHYTPELAARICERLSKGDPLARICADETMPHYATVRNWERDNEEFLALSTRAREDGTHFIADDCIRISDDLKIDPAHKRIMVDTRLRLIGKWNAKKYGERQVVEHAGSVGLYDWLLVTDG